MLTTGVREPMLGDVWTEELVRFEHLESLEFTFKDYEGAERTGWVIYAVPVDFNDVRGKYVHVDADGEGYSCVDDVARIAQAYLSYYERTRDERALKKSRLAVEFLLYMATGDGDFYNFIDRNGVINKSGNTSKARTEWWAARAFYALGKGIRIIGSRDPGLVKRMKTVYSQTLENVFTNRAFTKLHPDIVPVYRQLGIPPGDLVNDSGSITAIIVLGLLEGYQATADPRCEELIFAFCSALEKLEERSFSHYPFTGLHYPTAWNLDMVHLYGNRQVQALAKAGSLFGVTPWLESAEREVDIAYPRILTSGMIPFAFSPEPEEYPALPYAVETIVTNLMEIYRATGREKYAILAGLYAAWFFGDNEFNQPVCIVEKGRCFDGIDSHGVSKNSGAESVVEALLALGAIQGTPAEKYIYMKKDDVTNPVRPMLIPVELTARTEGEITWINRKFTGGSEKRIALLGAPARMEFSVDNLLSLQYHAFLSYQYKEPGEDGELLTTVNGKESVVSLTHCREDYHHRLAYLGTFKPNGDMGMKISVENRTPGRYISISTLILQPEIQRRGWSRNGHHITVVAGMLPEDQKSPFHGGNRHKLENFLAEEISNRKRPISSDRWLLSETWEIGNNGGNFSI